MGKWVGGGGGGMVEYILIVVKYFQVFPIIAPPP